ncbi:hypothetical protein LSTR_LSTR001319 [Laodelphax striatellus]|uniref:Uncharacterized protein n=1 Tax=Laodelphax striatellus TaxID=195883 RepID=A0A482XGU0_LAOST|nr:hypothetical protein LSTR_LSTR001319 [Laodelphax striatellus]
MLSTNCTRNDRKFEKLQIEKWYVIMMNLFMVLAIYTLLVRCLNSENIEGEDRNIFLLQNLKKRDHGVNRRGLDIMSQEANDKKDLKVNFYQSSTLFNKQPGRIKEQDSIEKTPMESMENSVMNNSLKNSTENDLIKVTGNLLIQSVENNKTQQSIDNSTELESMLFIDSVLENSTDNNSIQYTIYDFRGSNISSPMEVIDMAVNSTPMKLLVPIINNLINSTSTQSTDQEEEDFVRNTSLKPIDVIDFISYTIKSISPETEDSISSIFNTTIRVNDHTDEKNALLINDLDRKEILKKFMRSNETGSTMKSMVTNVNNLIRDSSIKSKDPDPAEIDSTDALGLIKNIAVKNYINVTPIKIMNHEKDVSTITSQPLIFPAINIKELSVMSVTENSLLAKDTPSNNTNFTGFDELSKQKSWLLNYKFHPTASHETKVTESSKGAKDLYLCDEFGCSKISGQNVFGISYTKPVVITDISIPTSTKKSLEIEKSKLLESISSTEAISHTAAKLINQALEKTQYNLGRQFHNPKQKVVPYSTTKLSKSIRTTTGKSASKNINVGKYNVWTLSDKDNLKSDNQIVDQIQRLVKTQQNQGNKLDEILKQQEYLNRKLDNIISSDGLKTVSSNFDMKLPVEIENNNLAILSAIKINYTTTEFHELISSKDGVSTIEHPYQNVAQMMRGGTDSYWNSNQTSGYYLGIIKNFEKILNKNPK